MWPFTPECESEEEIVGSAAPRAGEGFHRTN